MQITKTMYFTTLAITLIEVKNYAKINTIFKEVIKNTWVYRQHIKKKLKNIYKLFIKCF